MNLGIFRWSCCADTTVDRAITPSLDEVSTLGCVTPQSEDDVEESSLATEEILKDTTQWWEKNLPRDLDRSEVYVVVGVAQKIRKHRVFAQLGQDAAEAVQDVLRLTYSFTPLEARFVLRVMVVDVTDGGMAGEGPLMVPAVALAWCIFPNVSYVDEEPEKYGGGTVVTWQHVKSADFWDMSHNQGAMCVKRNLADEAALEVIRQVRVGVTKFFEPAETTTEN